MAFLPTTREEMLEQGFDEVDFVYVCGDAYVDHPSFDVPLLRVRFRHMAIVVQFWHSLTGIMMKNLNSLEHHVWDF